MTTLLLDTHVLHWSSMDPTRLSQRALQAIQAADELAVSAVTWMELAQLAAARRLVPPLPVLTWLERLSREVRSMPVTPAIAVGAFDLPRSFPRDPADRVIWATAGGHGWRLVTKDERMRAHDREGAVVVW